MREQQIKDDNFLKALAKQYVKDTGQIYINENAAIHPAPTQSMDAKMRAARNRQKWQVRRRAIMGVAASVVILIIMGITFLPEILRNNLQHSAPEFTAENMAPAVADNATGAAGVPAPDIPAVQALPPAPEAVFEIMEAEADAVDADDMFAWSTPPPGDVAADIAYETITEETEMYLQAAPVPNIAQISLSPPPGWQIIYTDFDGEMIIFHLQGAAQNLVVVTAALPPEENDFLDFFPVLINETIAFMRIESTHSVLIYEANGVQFTLTTAYDYYDLITLAHNWV